MQIASPTGAMPLVRNDGWGEGMFGSKRGSKQHDGIDLIVTPGQPIFSMIDGTVEKYEQCYRSDTRWTGIQVANTLLRVELWYMEPTKTEVKVGQFVLSGQYLGKAQDISVKYPPTDVEGTMTPHIHVRVTLRSFTTISEGRWVSYEQYIDPLLLLNNWRSLK
jgi:hypothetical protein